LARVPNQPATPPLPLKERLKRILEAGSALQRNNMLAGDVRLRLRSSGLIDE